MERSGTTSVFIPNRSSNSSAIATKLRPIGPVISTAKNLLKQYLRSMADVHNKETCSYNMSQIRSRNTKPEMLVRKFLHAHGFRYRLHVKNLPGKPDIVLPKYKTVIILPGRYKV